jgi:hypothetical protein
MMFGHSLCYSFELPRLRWFMKLGTLLAALPLIVSSLFAQDSEELMRGPDGGTTYHVDGISVRPLPGQPFSGRSTTEWTRTLDDGSVVITHLFAMVARDGHGRIYREGRNFVPVNSDKEPRRYQFKIMDPITHTLTICVVATRSCSVSNYFASTSFALRPVGPFDDGKRSLARESIGNDVMDGINVVGTRETVTINAGVIGNSEALSITREFWYAPELQVNLAITRKDPREGTQVVRVHEVSRSEPDPSWFKVPDEYAVHDLRNSPKTAN